MRHATNIPFLGEGWCGGWGEARGDRSCRGTSQQISWYWKITFFSAEEGRQFFIMGGTWISPPLCLRTTRQHKLPTFLIAKVRRNSSWEERICVISECFGGVQFPATGCGCPKRGAKAQTSAAEPMGSGPIGNQQICCLCTRKKHEEEFKDLAFYELHFFRICWICNQDSSLCVSVRWPWRNLKQCLCQVLMTWHSHHWWVPILSPCGGGMECSQHGSF